MYMYIYIKWNMGIIKMITRTETFFFLIKEDRDLFLLVNKRTETLHMHACDFKPKIDGM